MRFAKNENGQKIEVEYSGQRAICFCCQSEVIGRDGPFRIKHWYHKNIKDCDSWHEPITQWHIDWQNQYAQECQEVEMIDSKDGTRHRADVRLNNGLVIEIQNSSINVQEIKQRENFYNTNGRLVWVLNGENLLKKCSIRYQLVRRGHYIFVTMPEYVDEVKKYDFDKLRDDFLDSPNLKFLTSISAYKNYDIRNGIDIKFNFDSSVDFHSIIDKLREEAYNQIELHYAENVLDIWVGFDFDYVSISDDSFKHVRLTKQYSRRFIDEMNSPVYIDNLKGLSKDHLFYYQKNQIVKKGDFISNHISN